MQLDDTICYCFHVTKRKIQNFVRIHSPRRASQLSECGGAGTGCGWCVSYLQRYFDESKSNVPAQDDAVSPTDYARQRGDYLKAGKGVAAPGAIPPPRD